jgi:ankyrin repeat protein
MASEAATPEQQLLAASASGDVAAISALLDDGADVIYQDPSDGMSALMKAADGGHVDAVAMLLEAGCPWNLQDHEGYTSGA